MLDPALTVFLRKEWRDLKSSPQILPGYLIMPVLVLVVPALMIALFPLDPANAPDPDIASLMRFATRDPLLTVYPEALRLPRLIIREAVMLFLLMPVLLSGMSAALAIAGEKQQRTLEPLLATPLSDRDFLVAKLLAILVPSVVATWLSAAAYTVVIGIVSTMRYGAPMLPGPAFGVVIVALVPLAGAAAALYRGAARRPVGAGGGHRHRRHGPGGGGDVPVDPEAIRAGGDPDPLGLRMGVLRRMVTRPRRPVDVAPPTA